MSAEDNYNYVISYGRVHVPVHRVYARPLTDVAPVPESSFGLIRLTMSRKSEAS